MAKSKEDRLCKCGHSLYEHTLDDCNIKCFHVDSNGRFDCICKGFNSRSPESPDREEVG